MHRIDTSTAQVDKFGTGKNGFTGGNPQTGVLPTALDADFFDSVQEEIAAVIESAGIVLDKTKNNQLAGAMKSLFNPGRLIGVKVITSTGTYIPTAGAKKGKARAVGGGGGGGGGAAAGSNQQSAGQGGQCGAYAEVLFDISAASYAVNIGSAGTAGTASVAAGAGGVTSIAGILTCPGGSPGAQGTTSSATITVANNAPSSTYPTISSGTAITSLPANPGEPFIVLGVLTGQLRGGRGGSNPFGIGGAPGSFGPGQVGKGYGAGGGGCSQGQGGAGDVGGAGLPGIIVIEEYA